MLIPVTEKENEYQAGSLVWGVWLLGGNTTHRAPGLPGAIGSKKVTEEILHGQQKHQQTPTLPSSSEFGMSFSLDTTSQGENSEEYQNQTKVNQNQIQKQAL